MTGVEEGVSYVRFLLFSMLFQGCVIVFAVVAVIVVGVVVSFFCASEGFNSSEVTSSSSSSSSSLVLYLSPSVGLRWSAPRKRCIFH